mgnify:CR=1 FL=1
MNALLVDGVNDKRSVSIANCGTRPTLGSSDKGGEAFNGFVTYQSKLFGFHVDVHSPSLTRHCNDVLAHAATSFIDQPS